MWVAAALALSVAIAGSLDAQVQTQRTMVEDSANVETGLEEIIIRGRRGPRWGELRAEVKRAQEAMFARFNEINSTDDFDIHCRGEKSGHFVFRVCMSNGWRGFAAKIGSESASIIQGNANPGAWFRYRTAQLKQQQLMIEEMRRLTGEDEQLKQANADLAGAQYELTLSLGVQTLARQAPPNVELPYDAKLMFEVIMGSDPWKHPLTERTFTIANVFGEVRKMEIECAEGKQRIDYQAGLDWSVPDHWSDCVLQVRAKRETTFRLYEF
jgi:hypothetical protein